MPPAVKQDVAPDPADVGLLGPPAVVPRPDALADAIEEPRSLPVRGSASRTTGAKERRRARTHRGRRHATDPATAMTRVHYAPAVSPRKHPNGIPAARRAAAAAPRQAGRLVSLTGASARW